jgi:hypothetical protein
MKKTLLFLLTIFLLNSCSKTETMSQKTTIYYNGVEYKSNQYTTEIEVLPPNILNPDPTKNSIEVTMYTSETEGFIFTYYYTDRHSFSLIANASNQFKSTFVGDIEYVSDRLIGKAYDTKGNYIFFENI